MAAKKDKMIPSEKERKRALKYATPAGTGRMWVTMGIAFIIFGIILLLIPIGLAISEASAQRYDPESIHTATLVFYLLGAFFGFCGCFCVIFGKLAVKAFAEILCKGEINYPVAEYKTPKKLLLQEAAAINQSPNAPLTASTFGNWIDFEADWQNCLSIHNGILQSHQIFKKLILMLEMNPNSMGFWFPPLVEGLYGSAFFKVPDTKILRVPITMLQLTRLGFETLNPVTKEIVNRYCQKVFHLDGYEDYFIKTGTYSSKYEFRNAHIHNPKEINEMGEYFLFLNHLTCSMASPLNNRCFYGANTTNEWVVREYIKDKENNPTIYNGLPLHTEYRVFVDFDTKEILGASPYWRSDVMKNEFKKVSSPQERHDYVVYKMHEDILNQRYHESVQTVLAELKKVIPRIELTGQWSVDVMRNGNDYYIIDMALAEHSALNDCVPKNLLRAYPQQWLPGESNN